MKNPSGEVISSEYGKTGIPYIKKGFPAVSAGNPFYFMK